MNRFLNDEVDSGDESSSDWFRNEKGQIKQDYEHSKPIAVLKVAQHNAGG